MHLLRGKKIVLAVAGGITAFRSPELAHRLIRDGASVRVVMSRSSQRFVTPLTFEVITGNPAICQKGAVPIDPATYGELFYWADAAVAAPATADLIAKTAAGIPDDLVGSFLLSLEAPIVFCPAMSEAMFEHPAVQANLTKLETMGHRIVEAGPGNKACGWEERGRMAEIDSILQEVRAVISFRDLGGLRLAGAAR